MADEEKPGQDYNTNGTTYRIPKLTDTADAVVAFTDYSDSIPFSEYIVTETVTADTVVDDSYNGKMIVAQADITLTFGTLQNGFSVACVADGEYTISYEGVDKENQQTQAYEVATVVTVNDRNILSVARAQSDNIIIDQGPAEGTPPAPVISYTEGDSVVYFSPGEIEEEYGEAMFYSAKIRRQDNADLTTETVTVDQDNMEVVILGTEIGVSYIVDIYGINDEGKGAIASTEPLQLNYNKASGGVTTFATDPKYPGAEIYDDYNGTGQKWAVHTFSNSDTFKVETAVRNFRYVVVAGGGGAGGGSGNIAQGWTAGGGGSGGVLNNDDLVLPLGEIPITVGNGGNGAGHSASGSSPRGAKGGNSSIGDFIVTEGGGGGNHSGGAGGSGGGGGFANSNGGGGGGILGQGTSGTGGNGQSQPGGNGGGAGDGTSTAHTAAGRWDNITDVDVQYSNRYGPIGGGGPGNTRYETKGANGKKGIVIVAYQIGTSATREIENARKMRSQRNAAIEQGIQEGIEQGYSQAQEELQEELTSLRTQLSAVGTSDV